MKRLENEWKRYWGERTKKEGNYFGKGGGNANRILKAFKVSKSDSVLDIGCANGVHLADVQKRTGADCYGIDISPVPVKLNKNKKIDLRVGDMEEIPFKNKKFSRIFSLGTVEHSSHSEEIFREINRVLKKKGEIYITVPNKISFFHITKNIKILLGLWNLGYEKSFSGGEIKELLDKTGFKLKQLWIKPHLYPRNPFNFLDNLLNRINPSKFGFFIHFVAKKVKDV